MGVRVIWALVLQAVVFVVWAALAFATLFHLRKRAADRTGRPIPGPIAFVSATQDWRADPDFARSRRSLWLATVLLLAVSVLVAYLPGA